MNIFFLDARPINAARFHGDRHVVKMVLETAQLLSTAHRVVDSIDDDSKLYKATHINHPMSKWVRSSWTNYIWAYGLFHHLCDEYTNRFGKIHKSSSLMSQLDKPPIGIQNQSYERNFFQNTIRFRMHLAFTMLPPLCMPNPNIFKSFIETLHDQSAYSVTHTYRNYYLLKWLNGTVEYNKGRAMPKWLKTRIQNLDWSESNPIFQHTKKTPEEICILRLKFSNMRGGEIG